MICGENLEYYDTGHEFTCVECGNMETGYVNCSRGHYVCDSCHGERSFETVKKMISDSKDENPFEIAERIINEAQLPMLGCEHAWIAGGALLAALRNHGSLNLDEGDLEEVLMRTRRQAVGAYCGLTGVCGIAPAIGSVYSVILGAACPKNEETSATMKVVSEVIHAISEEAGPCCCKNFVFTALEAACRNAGRYLDTTLDYEADFICSFSDRHPHGCRRELCRFYHPIDE